MTDNLRIWSRVEKTDPAATKRINQRGGFTAIDAYSQIKMATEVFGPVGDGWGWKLVDVTYPPDGTVVICIELWYECPTKAGGHQKSFIVFGQKKLGDDKRSDEDAFKKALTDAITKGLSYLGFNGDVFLGRFDDNKYVQQRTAEVAAEADGFEAQTWIDEQRRATKEATDIIALTKVAKDIQAKRNVAKGIDPIGFNKLSDEFTARRAELEKQAA